MGGAAAAGLVFPNINPNPNNPFAQANQNPLNAPQVNEDANEQLYANNEQLYANNEQLYANLEANRIAERERAHALRRQEQAREDLERARANFVDDIRPADHVIVDQLINDDNNNDINPEDPELALALAQSRQDAQNNQEFADALEQSRLQQEIDQNRDDIHDRNEAFEAQLIAEEIRLQEAAAALLAQEAQQAAQAPVDPAPAPAPANLTIEERRQRQLYAALLRQQVAQAQAQAPTN
jgi:hypothetical protein